VVPYLKGMRNMAKAVKAVKAVQEPVTSFKGFDQDWKCRGYQFAVGATFDHAGKVKACTGGFHACESPLDVFAYYPPGTSRYAAVTQAGKIARHGDDTKITSARITIDAEIKLPEFITAAVKWVGDHCTATEGKHAEGHQSAASSTGDRSAASSRGPRSAASSTGHQSAASSTGYGSAASSTGDRSAASSKGDRSSASSTGDRSAAMSAGMEGRVMAAEGCALFLVYRRPDNYDIMHAWAGIAGKNGIKPLVWYVLGADGQPVEV
jgi:hypothetical protein